MGLDVREWLPLTEMGYTDWEGAGVVAVMRVCVHLTAYVSYASA